MLMITRVLSSLLLVRAASGVIVPRIACVGETLYDSLPKGLFLGGAPLNAAVHAAALGATASLVSAVGDDVVGRDAVRRLREAGVDTSCVQTVNKPTGFVTCVVDKGGDAGYEFETPAAWDFVRATEDVRAAVAKADAVVHGSLALRGENSEVHRILAAAPKRVFDVNLRPPYVDRERIEPLLRDCWVLKMNEEEARQVATWVVPDKAPKGLRGLCDALCAELRPEFLVVTLAEKGAVMLHRSDVFYEAQGTIVDVIDTVGAGDAFTARLVVGLQAGDDAHETLRAAARLGSWVATKEGATPSHDDAFLDASCLWRQPA
ncbi:hypothetical protein CTAYLR_009318 [Chrysophaeum taylorii]|uniref:Carbohydrate kinase PfkB domain-containing protein n=1 Tax=Chrysophaeum taylorii TaxID=2483200 RepID=A0AAD7UHC3_9STRA|nr:hypothetical protein CTAYLR_009318 [Chrysophaeum taylorii]